MYKKIIACAAALTFVFASAAMPESSPLIEQTSIETSAYGVEYGDYNYILLDDGTAEIAQYKGKSANVVIPSVIDGKTVTSIGMFSFMNSEAESITLPNTVTNISAWAFSGCESMTGISIPDSVKAIGECAFFDCSSLKSIVIPNGVTTIAELTFGGCESLSSVTIPNSVTSIETAAFYYCPSLTKVDIPDSVTSLGDYAFAMCDKLTSITIPAGVTDIGEGAYGYTYDEKTDDVYQKDKTQIVCESGSAAEQYAKENGFRQSGTQNGKAVYYFDWINDHSTVVMTDYTSTTDAVRINWKPVYNACGYRVYRYENGKWKSIKTLGNGDVTTFKDNGLKAGTAYKYKVKAYIRENGEAVWGKASSVFTAAAKPAAPTIKKTSQSASAVRLYWNKVACSGYKIQQYDTKTKSWKTVKLVSSGKTDYKVTGLKKGTSYKFRIQAYKTAGDSKAFSKWSASKSATTKK